MDISGWIYDYDVDIACGFVHAFVFQSPWMGRDTMETTIEVAALQKKSSMGDT
jgi:hypothetical protein